MSKDDYSAGYQAGRHNAAMNSSDLDYRQGYSSGKQAYDFWNDKDLYPSLRDDNLASSSQHSSTPGDGPLTLASAIFGSIALTLLWWAFIGFILLLFWIGGRSGDFWFQLVFQFALWSGIGFIIIMTVIGIILAIMRQVKNHSD